MCVKNVEWNNYGLYCSTVPVFAFKKLGKYVKKKTHGAGVRAEFLSVYLPNMKWKV
jgi:hypothetical protein